MIVDRKILKRLYDKYNQEYFLGYLPTCPLYTHDSYRLLGHYSFELGRNGSVIGHSITISDSYDWTEEQLRDVLVHEMVHEYLIYYGLDDTGKHTKLFKSFMNRLNKEHGLNMAVITDLTDFKVRKGKSTLGKIFHTLF